MKEFTEEDIERIGHLIDDKNEEGVRTEIADYHPADIAELLREISLKEAEWLFNLIEDQSRLQDI